MALLRSMGSECISVIWGSVFKNKRVLVEGHFCLRCCPMTLGWLAGLVIPAGAVNKSFSSEQ